MVDTINNEGPLYGDGNSTSQAALTSSRVINNEGPLYGDGNLVTNCGLCAIGLN